MSAPPKRTGHDWSHETPRLSPWWFLSCCGPGELELVRGRGLVTGTTRVCDRCGIVVVYGSLCGPDGAERPTAFYGWDFDSLTPMRVPPCEVLVRPGSTEAELVSLVDERQLELDLGTGAAA